MPPSLALVLWFVLLLALLRYDSARTQVSSTSLWIPTAWLFILSSRSPSQWLGTQGYALQALQEGNSLDRAVYLFLISLALGVLVARRVNWGEIFKENFAFLAVLAFALVSVVWSDFPFVAFKRWFRDLGLYLAVLIVLCDPRPMVAMRIVLRRVGFLLIPLSIMLYKYYPDLGRQYDVWTGAASYVGATTSKNMLGLLCLVTGLVFVWDTLLRWRDRHGAHMKEVIAINLAFIAMIVWLLFLSNSATSGACLVLGCVVLVVSYSDTQERRSAILLKYSIPLAICLLAALLALGFDIGATVAPALGRDVTLTGRTDIWKILIGMQENPLTGAGYESFWLGARLERVWISAAGSINQAHNGYLQVYLNLGLLGLLFVLALLGSAYIRVWQGLKTHPNVASFGLALWTVLIVYNVTEAAFLGGLLWAALVMFTGSLTEKRKTGQRQLTPPVQSAVLHRRVRAAAGGSRSRLVRVPKQHGAV